MAARLKNGNIVTGKAEALFVKIGIATPLNDEQKVVHEKKMAEVKNNVQQPKAPVKKKPVKKNVQPKKVVKK